MCSCKLQKRALWIGEFVRASGYVVGRRADETRNPPLISQYPRLNFSHSYPQEQSSLRRQPTPSTEQRRRASVTIEVYADQDWHHLRQSCIGREFTLHVSTPAFDFCTGHAIGWKHFADAFMEHRLRQLIFSHHSNLFDHGVLNGSQRLKCHWRGVRKNCLAESKATGYQ